jgi:hypothetical protein
MPLLTKPTSEQRTAIKELRAQGIKIEVNDFDEYVVNFKNGKEATAYFASDPTDAIDTGRAMIRRRKETV